MPRRPSSKARRVADALDAALEALARRDLTEQELVERLARLGVPEEERADTVARLRRLGYVDDGKVAAARAEHLVERGQSDAAIRADLSRRGVPDHMAAETVAALEPERARAARLAERLGGGPRAARALARKGFAGDSIEPVLAAIAKDT